MTYPHWTDNDRAGLIDRLRRYGFARNRDVDHVDREVTITDNEAVWLLDMLGELDGMNGGNQR